VNGNPRAKPEGFSFSALRGFGGGRKFSKAKILPLRPQIVPLPEAKNIRPFSPNRRMVGIDNCINAVHREINFFVCFPPLVKSRNEPAKSTIRNSALSAPQKQVLLIKTTIVPETDEV